MFLGTAVFFGFVFSILAVMRQGILLPGLIVYAVLPIRVWTDASVALPGVGSLLLDTILALFFSILIVIRLVVASGVRNESLNIIWGLWFFLGLAAISAFFMGLMGQVSGFKMLIRLSYPVLVFMLVLKDYRNDNDPRKIINFILVVGLLVSLSVLIANIMGISSWRWSAGINRFAGLGSVSDYAYLMGMMGILSYVMMKSDKRKIIYGLLSFLFVAQTFMTVTRGAIFATVIAFIAIEVFSGSKKLTTKMLMPIVLLSLLFSAVVFYEPLRSRVFGSHYADISSMKGASLADKFSKSFTKSGRESLWTYVADNILYDPHIVFGYGIGSAEIDLVRDIGGVTHNEYVRILYEMGVVGLVFFIIANYQLLKINLRLSYIRYDKISMLIAACCLGVLVLYVFGALVDNMINKYKNMGAPLLMFSAFSLMQIARCSRKNDNITSDISNVDNTNDVTVPRGVRLKSK